MSYASRKVSEIMNPNPPKASPNEKVEDIVRKMYEHGSSSVIIVDVDDHVIGIFTERDLVKMVANKIPTNVEVAKVMTKNPVTLKYDEPVSKAIIIMSEKGFRNLPIVDEEGRLKGLITSRMLTKTFGEFFEE